MDNNYLSKDELIVGALYEIRARNFKVAVWTGDALRGAREKFGKVYLDDEYLWDEGGTVHVIKRIEDWVIPSFDRNDKTLLAMLAIAEAYLWRIYQLETAINLAGFDIEETSFQSLTLKSR